MSLGKLIAFEGVDASGKGTQSKLLKERLVKEGFPTESISFPRHETIPGSFVDQYLIGHYGSLEDLDPKACSIFYAIDRFDASFEIRKWLNQGKVVISDRYTGSNKGHQTSKISDYSERLKFIDWANNLEYKIFNLPKEDINIFLDMPVEWSFRLIAGRNNQISEVKKDLHEENSSHLYNTLNAYHELIEYENNKNIGKWAPIDCVRNNELLSVDEIHNTIWDTVKPLLYK